MLHNFPLAFSWFFFYCCSILLLPSHSPDIMPLLLGTQTAAAVLLWICLNTTQNSLPPTPPLIPTTPNSISGFLKEKKLRMSQSLVHRDSDSVRARLTQRQQSTEQALPSLRRRPAGAQLAGTELQTSPGGQHPALLPALVKNAGLLMMRPRKSCF